MIHKIVLTGGPCAGKTTALMRVKNFLEGRGFTVLTIPEAATITCSIGIGLSHQLPISRIQKNTEDVVFAYAEMLAKESKQVVVLLDRGLIDGSVYIDADAFQKVLNELGLKDKAEVFRRYDSVFCLVSASKGAEMFYDRNEVRTESLSFAKEVDSKTAKAWEDFGDIKFFDNINKSFESKMRAVVGEICAILDIPHTEKIPKKYYFAGELFTVPSDLATCTNEVEKVFIRLTASDASGEDNAKSYSFIRRSLYDHVPSFVLKTVAFRGNQRIERKENLTARQYESFKQFADPSRRVVRQKRTVFSIGVTHYDICEYLDTPKETYLLSIYNLQGESALRELPGFLSGFQKVATSHGYTAHYMSLHDKSGAYEFANDSEHVRYEKA